MVQGERRSVHPAAGVGCVRLARAYRGVQGGEGGREKDFGEDEMNLDWHAITMIFGLGIFTYYEIHRQWPKEKHPGVAQFVERNWPRIIFSAILIPGTAQVLTEWLKTLI